MNPRAAISAMTLATAAFGAESSMRHPVSTPIRSVDDPTRRESLLMAGYHRPPPEGDPGHAHRHHRRRRLPRHAPRPRAPRPRHAHRCPRHGARDPRDRAARYRGRAGPRRRARRSITGDLADPAVIERAVDAGHRERLPSGGGRERPGGGGLRSRDARQPRRDARCCSSAAASSRRRRSSSSRARSRCSAARCPTRSPTTRR